MFVRGTDQFLIDFPAPDLLKSFFSFDRFAFFLVLLVIDDLPGPFLSSMTFMWAVVFLQPLLKVVGIADVIASILEAFEYVDVIGHDT